MSGAWAREADAVRLHGFPDLVTAVEWLALGLRYAEPARCSCLAQASAIIRRERRRLDPEGLSLKQPDWPESMSEEGLIWRAMAHVAGANSGPGAWNLRHAEAALRTLHKRGRS